jgi:integrase
MFMKFCKTEDYDMMLQIDPKKLENTIRDYIIHLKADRKLSFNSVNLYLGGISHFYQMNGLVLNTKRLAKFKGKKRLIVEDKPYSKVQIRQLLDFSNLRMKCIILLMCSAGLRRGAITTLRIGDLKKIEKYNLYRISVYKKEREAYYCFCTPECSKQLDQYFNWRELQGEKLNDKSPIIRNEFYNVFDISKPLPLSVDSISWLINELLDKSGIRPRSENNLKRTEIMQCHGFRKYFETTSKLAGMDLLLLNRCMGHSSGLEDSYLKLSEDQILEGNDKMIGYVGAIDDLTINNEGRLQRKISVLEAKNNEVQSLKEKMALMESSQADMMELLKHPKQLLEMLQESET